MTVKAPRLQLIDDKYSYLVTLDGAVRKALDGVEADIEFWHPSQSDGLKDWQERTLANRPDFIVTDLDLTENGAPGLLGGGLVAFCRAHVIPIGIYSRQTVDDLEEPQIFDFRFDSAPDEAAVDIANLLIGFDQLAKMLREHEPQQQRNWAATLADLLEHPEVASSFSLYSVRSGASPNNVLGRLSKLENRAEAKIKLETYVIGHLLCNSILKYPGPLMSDRMLCSYAGLPDEYAAQLSDIFKDARYTGPFGDRRSYFWQRSVDDIYANIFDELQFDEQKIEDLSADELRRKILTAKLGELKAHDCDRCGGLRGGYRCPYKDRPTCNRNDCSYPTSSWVPQGAFLTRPEKNFVDEHSPLLGL